MSAPSPSSSSFLNVGLTESLSFVGSLLPTGLAKTLELDLGPLLSLGPIDRPTRSLNPNITEVYSSEFGFERVFESRSRVDQIGAWMQANWTSSIFISIVYIILVFVGRKLMESRPKYELRKPLIVWNLFLAAFSIMGTIRVWPEFLHAIFNRGIVYSVCDYSFAYSITGFWAYLFCMSKLPELIDTLFIVLRKQELIFLHYYHHATVLIYCWFSYKDFAASGRWFMCMNYVVHSIMYSYYALKAMRFRVPVAISKLITFLQIVQMLMGCYVNWVAYSTKLNSPETSCHISDNNIFYSFLMYLSYFALFFHFFLNAYIKKNAKHRKAAAEKMALEAQQNGVNGMNGHVKNGNCVTANGHYNKKSN